jgi:2,4-dienoyl-CoA reductase-like NADH-dependent reductase (Old Yellow Enzyme family)
VEQLRDDFIAAALRSQAAGFDGVQVHGAHGYILAQFLSSDFNRRQDRYGGSLENRARLLVEMIDGVRAACRSDFQIGVRLSPERYGQKLAEVRDVAAELLRREVIDYLDLSLWDVTKSPEDQSFGQGSLLSHFTTLARGQVRLGAAGKVMSAQAALGVIRAGCDFVSIGRAAILRHDFPQRVSRDSSYDSPPLPIQVEHLLAEGLSPPFIDYMRTWPGFLRED